MQYLRRNTAATVLIGPFLDRFDGLTPETGLTAGTVDEIGIYKHNGTSLINISGTTTLTHRAGGMYTATLSASDTNTAGRTVMYVRDDSVALPRGHDFSVIPENVYDDLFGEAASGIQDVISVVENQRGTHTVQGKVFYVDPVNGDTHANGNRGGPDDPYAGVQDCHDNAVTDNNHDLIVLVAGSGAGATTLTESVTISKNYTFVRGPGRDFIWTPPGTGDTITVTANGVELAGFQLNTAASGSGNGITATSANFLKVRDMWINDTRGDAIEATDCDNLTIERCSLQGSGTGGSGHGISIGAGNGETASYGLIRHNYINDVQGDGIQLDTTGTGTVEATVIEYNVIQGCVDDGVDIVDSGCTNTMIRDNRFGNNTNGNIEDAGTNTIDIWNFPVLVDLNGRVDVSMWRGVDVSVEPRSLLPKVHSFNTSIRSGQIDDVNLTTVTLFQDGFVSSIDDFYNGYVIFLHNASGEGHHARLITDYDGTNGICTVSPAFASTPDAIDRFEIVPASMYLNDATPFAGANIANLDALVSSRLAAADITLTSGKVTPIDADGLTFISVLEALLAVLSGVATVSGSTVSFKKRDGTTSKMTITYGAADGERTASVVDS